MLPDGVLNEPYLAASAVPNAADATIETRARVSGKRYMVSSWWVAPTIGGAAKAPAKQRQSFVAADERPRRLAAGRAVRRRKARARPVVASPECGTAFKAR